MIRNYFTRAAKGSWVVLLCCGMSVLTSGFAVQHSPSAHSGALAVMLYGIAALLEVLAVVQWRFEVAARGE